MPRRLLRIIPPMTPCSSHRAYKSCTSALILALSLYPPADLEGRLRLGKSQINLHFHSPCTTFVFSNEKPSSTY